MVIKSNWYISDMWHILEKSQWLQLIGKTKVRGCLCKTTWEDNIRMELKETGWKLLVIKLEEAHLFPSSNSNEPEHSTETAIHFSSSITIHYFGKTPYQKFGQPFKAVVTLYTIYLNTYKLCILSGLYLWLLCFS